MCFRELNEGWRLTLRISRTSSTLDYLSGVNKQKSASNGYRKLSAAQLRSRSQKWIAMPGKNWTAIADRANRLKN
jgi:hypothetical protein